MAIYMKRTTSKIVSLVVRILELLSSIFHNASAAPLAWDVILAAFSAAFYVLLSLRCTSRIRPLIFAQSQVLSLFFCGLGRRCRLLKISSLCCACLYFLLNSKAANRLRVAVPTLLDFTQLQVTSRLMDWLHLLFFFHIRVKSGPR